jgi:hypothetical protein
VGDIRNTRKDTGVVSERLRKRTVIRKTGPKPGHKE